MSSSRPAATASAVRCRSSGLGIGSPDRWLWTRMRRAACMRTASRKSSATRTTAVGRRCHGRPWARRGRRSGCRAGRPGAPPVPGGRSRGRDGSARSRGLRMTHRPGGQSGDQAQAGKLEGGHELGRPCRPDAGRPLQLGGGEQRGQPGEACAADERLLRHGRGVRRGGIIQETHSSPMSSAAERPAGPRDRAAPGAALAGGSSLTGERRARGRGGDPVPVLRGRWWACAKAGGSVG